MSYHLTNRIGATEASPSVRRMRDLLDELTSGDPEHPDVSLTHESGWTLSVFSGGLVIWEDVEGDARPRHMRGITADKALELWIRLSRGEIDSIESENWQSGYGSI